MLDRYTLLPAVVVPKVARSPCRADLYLPAGETVIFVCVWEEATAVTRSKTDIAQEHLALSELFNLLTSQQL